MGTLIIDRILKNLEVSEDTHNTGKILFHSKFGKIEVFFEYNGIDFKVTESYDYNNNEWSFTYSDKEADLIAEKMQDLKEEDYLKYQDNIIDYMEEQSHRAYLSEARFYL